MVASVGEKRKSQDGDSASSPPATKPKGSSPVPSKPAASVKAAHPPPSKAGGPLPVGKPCPPPPPPPSTRVRGKSPDDRSMLPLTKPKALALTAVPLKPKSPSQSPNASPCSTSSSLSTTASSAFQRTQQALLEAKAARLAKEAAACEAVHVETAGPVLGDPKPAQDGDGGEHVGEKVEHVEAVQLVEPARGDDGHDEKPVVEPVGPARGGDGHDEKPVGEVVEPAGGGDGHDEKPVGEVVEPAQGGGGDGEVRVVNGDRAALHANGIPSELITPPPKAHHYWSPSPSYMAPKRPPGGCLVTASVNTMGHKASHGGVRDMTTTTTRHITPSTGTISGTVPFMPTVRTVGFPRGRTLDLGRAGVGDQARHGMSFKILMTPLHPMSTNPAKTCQMSLMMCANCAKLCNSGNQQFLSLRLVMNNHLGPNILSIKAPPSPDATVRRRMRNLRSPGVRGRLGGLTSTEGH